MINYYLRDCRSVHRLFFVSHPGVGEQAFLEYVDAKWKTMLEADFQVQTKPKILFIFVWLCNLVFFLESLKKRIYLFSSS